MGNLNFEKGYKGNLEIGAKYVFILPRIKVILVVNLLSINYLLAQFSVICKWHLMLGHVCKICRMKLESKVSRWN